MPWRMNSRLMVLMALSCPSQIGTAVRIRIGKAISLDINRMYLLLLTFYFLISTFYFAYARSFRFQRQNRSRNGKFARHWRGDDSRVWPARRAMCHQLCG